ncbi:MAG: alpha-ketoacid dehydrogenase subunit beta [Gemmatimonadetes bacterium]|nr:alpha-ketoacid dehydrogenase subunit beta [Gemmatimonadota bacterium]
MAEVTYLEALRQGLWEELERDENVFMLGEDIGEYGGAFKVTEGFLEKFGAGRIIDTPISEAAIVGAAAGAAHMGMRPIAEMQFIDFISCAYDMLTNYVATARYRAGLATPIVVRGPSGGYVRGGPFHSQMPEAAFFHTPGLKLVCPATARDAKGLIKSAVRDDDPVIYFEHKFLYRRIKEDLPDDEEILTPIGKARVAREGSDLTIITWSAMVWKCLDAAEELASSDGASVEVLDLRSLIPMDDAAILGSVRKTNRVLIVHEDTRTGGIAGEITSRINEGAFEWLDAPVRRVTAHDTPIPYAPTLEDYVLPGADDVVEAARLLLAY